MARIIAFSQTQEEFKELEEQGPEQSAHNLSEELFSKEEVRAIKGCEHFSDEEANGVINSLVTFAGIIITSMSQPGTIVGTSFSINKQDFSKAA